MFEDSDEEISELDIESRTWNKLENKMKLIGFREGAAKGRDISLQEGFNLGFSDAFKIGEYLGILKGINSCQKELGNSGKSEKFKNEYFEILSSDICALCLKNKDNEINLNEESHFGKLENIISRQQSLTNEILKHLENSDFNIKEK